MNDAAFKAHRAWLAALRYAASLKCAKTDPGWDDYQAALDTCNAMRVIWLDLTDPPTPWRFDLHYRPRG